MQADLRFCSLRLCNHVSLEKLHERLHSQTIRSKGHVHRSADVSIVLQPSRCASSFHRLRSTTLIATPTHALQYANSKQTDRRHCANRTVELWLRDVETIDDVRYSDIY